MSCEPEHKNKFSVKTKLQYFEPAFLQFSGITFFALLTVHCNVTYKIRRNGEFRRLRYIKLHEFIDCSKPKLAGTESSVLIDL